MTDEEKRARALAFEYFPADSVADPCKRDGFRRGYAEACEDKRAEIDDSKRNYLNACQLVAAMHEAATGLKGSGTNRGVVEDVADVRSSLMAERAKSAKLVSDIQLSLELAQDVDAELVVSRLRLALADYEANK